MSSLHSADLVGDQPAAASAQGLADRSALALISVERTRMPMVVTDARQDDNPIVLANGAFLELTGYSADEVIGRNCRFMQGPATSPDEVARIRRGIAAEEEVTVELLNYRKDGSTFWNELFLSPVHDARGELLYFFASSKDVTKRREASALEREEHRLLLEIDHRAKNALALVQGFVRLSRSDDAAAYAASVQSRVDALARAHSMLAAQGWRDVYLHRLLHAEAEIYGSRRVVLSGPDIPLGARQVQPVGLFFHEMLSNAAKHGSLSEEAGEVSIRWEHEDGQDLSINWQETGGPPPSDHRPRSFGSALIEQIVSRQLSGTTSYDWQATGLKARFSFPLVKLGSPLHHS